MEKMIRKLTENFVVKLVIYLITKINHKTDHKFDDIINGIRNKDNAYLIHKAPMLLDVLCKISRQREGKLLSVYDGTMFNHI